MFPETLNHGTPVFGDLRLQAISLDPAVRLGPFTAQQIRRSITNAYYLTGKQCRNQTEPHTKHNRRNEQRRTTAYTYWSSGPFVQGRPVTVKPPAPNAREVSDLHRQPPTASSFLGIQSRKTFVIPPVSPRIKSQETDGALGTSPLLNHIQEPR